MRYDQFFKKFRKFPVLDMNMVLRITGEDPQIMRNQVTRWVKSHQLFQLKRGLYFFNDNERDAKGTNLYCANKIYAPSYISLETALSLYGIIPEGVSVVTSVTSKITKKFRNSLGYFTYQRIRTNAFRGFREDNFGGFPVYIAEPEKAVLDFLYLNSARFGKDPADQLRGSFRFQSGADIDPVRMRTLAAVFESKKLSRLAEAALDILGGD